jgi:hypothetical protein
MLFYPKKLMRPMCKHSIWKIQVTRKDIQVAPNRNNTKMLLRKERISGKGNTRRQQPLHISARIQVTNVTIAISILTLKKHFGNYIHS